MEGEMQFDLKLVHVYQMEENDLVDCSDMQEGQSEVGCRKMCN